MGFKLLNFIVFVITKDQLLPWFKVLVDTSLVDTLLSFGIKAKVTNTIPNPSCSQSINKPNILYKTVFRMLLSIVIHHLVQHSVMVMTFIYLMTLILIQKITVLFVVDMPTISLKVLMVIIQYSLMEIHLF
jgi:hypothetical protein